MRAQILLTEQVSGRVGQYQTLSDPQGRVDVDQLTGRNQTPAWVVVHPFGGEHN